LSSVLITVFLFGLYYWIARDRISGAYAYSSYFGLSLIPLLLFFRFVAENYFVWLIPFAALFVVKDYRGKIVLWAISLLALISSVTNSLLPYYMLPMAPWIGQYLVKVLSFFSPYRVGSGGVVVTTFSLGKLYLAGLGVLSALFLSYLAVLWIMADTGRRPKTETLIHGANLGQGPVIE
jgi:hypothetical protein